MLQPTLIICEVKAFCISGQGGVITFILMQYPQVKKHLAEVRSF